jgi:DNA-binding response OmpR family regulator
MNLLKMILAVSTDLEDYKHSTEAWGKHGYSVLRVDTMYDAIKRLSDGETFLFIGINEDTTDFWGQLPIMRDITSIPIFIITSTYNTEKKAKALTLGADGYDPFADDLEENVHGALALLEARSRTIEQRKTIIKLIFYDNILISPTHRHVFIGIKEAGLTKTEFDVLYYLMNNRRRVLTFKQIYRHVWGEDYDISVNNAVKNVVKRIRNKIDSKGANSSFIENVHGIGYRLPL